MEVNELRIGNWIHIELDEEIIAEDILFLDKKEDSKTATLKTGRTPQMILTRNIRR